MHWKSALVVLNIANEWGTIVINWADQIVSQSQT